MNFLSKGRSTFDLISEQVARRDVDEVILFDKNAALSKLCNGYVPFPDPGPPRTKIISAGLGGKTLY
jgi:hypothetical protein